jgi:hypothetical protein
MSKQMRILAIVGMIAGAVAAAPSSALAYHHGHGSYRHGGGYYHGGGWGWGGYGWGWGWGPAFAYYPPVYYAPPPQECGWVHVRVWRHGHWVLRRAWQCW